MPVSPEDFETHAIRVDDRYDDEISRRAVISRKYYYIFHKIREENESHPESEFTYRGQDHQEASNFLERLELKQLSDILDDLRNERNKADYDIDDPLGEFEYQMFQADLEDFKELARQENILS